MAYFCKHLAFSKSVLVCGVSSLFFFPGLALSSVTSGTGVSSGITTFPTYYDSDEGTTSSASSGGFSDPLVLTKPGSPPVTASIPRNGSGTITVNAGLIQLSADVLAGAVNNDFTWSSIQSESRIAVSGYWADDVTIMPSDPSLIGKMGVLHGVLQRVGDVHFDNSGLYNAGSAQAPQYNSLFAVIAADYLRPSFNLQVFETNSNFPQGNLDASQSLTGEIPFTMYFDFGTKTTLSYGPDATAYASSDVNGWATASVDMSLWWGGITSVNVFSFSDGEGDKR